MKAYIAILCLGIVCCVPAAEAAENGQQGNAEELGEVVVTATRREMLLSDVPDVLQVITRREIEELNPSSTGELLEYVTGASIETGTGSGLPERHVVGLNGLPASYTLVLVDGVRLLSEHIHTGRNLELVPPHIIERIEIIRGAASAQYGADAIGGVVNIVTRKCGDRPETSLAGAAGFYETYEVEAAWMRPVTENIRLSMFLNREQSDGVPLKEPAHRVDNMGHKRFNLLSRVDVDLAESTNLFGWVNWVDNTVDWRGDEADSYLATGVLGVSHSFLPSLSLSAKISYTRWDAETNEEENELVQPESYITWHITDSNILTGGMDYKHHEFTRNAVEPSDQYTVGAFLQHEWRLMDGLTLMTALRYDDVEGIDAVLSPKASVLYSPDLPLRLRGSVSRGFHAPTPQELYEEGYGHGGRAYRFGNPNLEPEYSMTYSLGVELFPGDSFEVMLYGHFSELDDMIVPVYEGPWDEDPTIDVWRRTNIENARVYGGEVKARYTVSRNLRLEGGYSYTDSEDEESGRKLPYHPGSSAFFKAVAGKPFASYWKLSGFVGLRATFDRSAWNWKPPAGTSVDDPSGLTTELDDYEKLDAGVSLVYKDTYRIYLNVYNILGQDIESLDDLYTVLDGEPVVKGGFRCTW